MPSLIRGIARSMQAGGRLSLRSLEINFPLALDPNSDDCHHYPMTSKEKLAEQRKRREMRADLPRFLRSALRMKIAACKYRGVECDLDLEWLQQQPLMCALTGAKFEVPPAGIGPKTPSFDRIDHGKGYTKQNTRLVLYWINSARGTWTDEVLRGLIHEASEAFHGNSAVPRSRVRPR